MQTILVYDNNKKPFSVYYLSGGECGTSWRFFLIEFVLPGIHCTAAFLCRMFPFPEPLPCDRWNSSCCSMCPRCICLFCWFQHVCFLFSPQNKLVCVRNALEIAWNYLFCILMDVGSRVPRTFILDHHYPERLRKFNACPAHGTWNVLAVNGNFVPQIDGTMFREPFFALDLHGTQGQS